MEERAVIFLIGAILCSIGTLALVSANIQVTVISMGLGLSLIALALGKDAMEKLFDMFSDIFRSIFK